MKISEAGSIQKINRPLISIVMATYNGDKFIREQIESIANQSYKKIELIIQDDCSSDETVNIINSQKKEFPIKLEINSKNLGFVNNFEAGLSRAQGEYVALCDQDDIWRSDKLQKLIENIGHADLIHSDCQLIGDMGQVLSPTWKHHLTNDLTIKEFFFRNYVTGCTLLFKSELLKRAMPFPKEIEYHDWWLAILALNGNGIKYLHLPLTKYRQHLNQDTGSGENFGIFKNLIMRFDPIARIKRKKISSQHIKNLSALLLYEDFIKFKVEIMAAIEYHKSLSTRFFDWKLLPMIIKYHKNIRPFQPFSFIKGVIGEFL